MRALLVLHAARRLLFLLPRSHRATGRGYTAIQRRLAAAFAEMDAALALAVRARDGA